MVRIPLGILTYQRAEYLRKTLESFFNVNYACLDVFKPVVVLVQGKDPSTMSVLDSFSDFIDRTIVLKSNHGCAWGYTLINQELIEEGTDLVMHLQDDWEATEPLNNYLSMDAFTKYKRGYGIKELFEKLPEVGYMRLRSVIWSKVSNTHRITGKGIKWKLWATKQKKYGRILTSDAHYTFNPTIIRTSVLKKILPVTKERDAMGKFHELNMLAAQLRANCFMHIGHERAVGLEGGKWVR
jgi:hypothetical protein